MPLSPTWLNFNWVTSSLALGGRFPMEAAEHFAKNLGIRRIVDLRVEACDDTAVLVQHGIALLHLPTLDQCAVSLTMLDRGVAWVSREIAQGHKVYIHCEHGIGRSALLVCCVLVSQGFAPLDALSRAKHARGQVSPSPEQLNAFAQWSERWKQLHATCWTVPTFEQLGAIAYRGFGLEFALG